ncbi:MAG: hypothetical protein HN790_13380 [Methylococcales bacterium]|jgi:hypothetical protein|nr:hypothetical protein [Methylococcales bacterium]
MKQWQAELKLIATLSATKTFLLHSPNDGWPDEDPMEAAEVIDKMILNVLDASRNPMPEFASIYYSPTGPLQEIAMSNGWHEHYMALAAEYSKLAYLFQS